VSNSLISIIIPVFNEKEINQLLADVQGKTEPDSVQIIVVDAESNQSTLCLISDPSILKLTSSKGRGVQQNRGAREAVGDILLFLHADTILPENFQHLVQNTIEAGFTGGAFDLEIDDPHPLIRCISKAATLRSRLTGIPYGDQAIFTFMGARNRRAFLKRLNLFQEDCPTYNYNEERIIDLLGIAGFEILEMQQKGPLFMVSTRPRVRVKGAYR